MFSYRILHLLFALVAVQGVYSAPAAPEMDVSAPSTSVDLVVRTGDRSKVTWDERTVSVSAAIGAVETLGIMIGSLTSAIFNFMQNKPSPESSHGKRLCGSTKLKIFTADDGKEYKAWAYTYTTGTKCDSTQQAKTLTSGISDGLDELYKDEAAAGCYTLQHGAGTWHAVVGVATVASGEDPRPHCDQILKDIQNNSDKDSSKLAISPSENVAHGNSTAPSLQRREIGGSEASNVEVNDERLLPRTGIKVTQTKVHKGKVAFDPVTKAQAVIVQVGTEIKRQSSAGSCAVISSQIENYGKTYVYRYYATGRNCDTTAQIKTIVADLDDAWHAANKAGTSAVCMTMDHGGTWRGHLSVSVMNDQFPVTDEC